MFSVTGGRHVKLTTEQFEQPFKQPATSTVHTARSAQLSYGLFVANSRVTDSGPVTVAHADNIEEIGVQLLEGRGRRPSKSGS